MTTKKKQPKKSSRKAECEISVCFCTSATHKIRHIKRTVLYLFFAVQITSVHYFKTQWHFFVYSFKLAKRKNHHHFLKKHGRNCL